MQSQEHSYEQSYEQSSIISPDDRVSNTDPRETGQQQEYTSQSYEEGYTGSSNWNAWTEGEKLRPEMKSEKSPIGPVGIIVIVCAAFVAGSFLHIGFGWLDWLIAVVLAFVGVAAIISNWRVVTIPMPLRTFQIAEHARLVINNGAGKVEIKRGEDNVVSVAATKRASGIGVSPEGLQVDYEQHSDNLNITNKIHWNIFQFGYRAVDFEITVPANCDVQLENGAGKVAVQGTTGTVRVRTGSGSIQAHDLRGQIAMKTGSGRIESSNLQGQIDLRTGSSRIEAHGLQGQINLRTGSSRIEASNIQGQVTAQTGSGHIEFSQAALSGNSLLKTGSSSIAFDGTLDPAGSYRMETGSGGINLNLPPHAAFRLDARTGSGGVHNMFGSKEVGAEPRAPLRLRSGSGSIRIANMGMDVLR